MVNSIETVFRKAAQRRSAVRIIVAAICLSCFSGVSVAQGLGGFAKKASGIFGGLETEAEEAVADDDAQAGAAESEQGGSTAPVPMDALTMQDALIINYLGAAAYINESQALLAEAFDLKDEAAELRAQGEVLSSGAVLEKDAIKTATEVSERANEAIAEKLEEGAQLSDEAKEQYAEAIPPYIKGLTLMAGLSDDFASFGNAAQSRVRSAPLTQKWSVKKELEAGTYIATSIPGFTRDLYVTSKSLLTFANAQSIPIPEDATDALDDFF